VCVSVPADGGDWEATRQPQDLAFHNGRETLGFTLCVFVCRRQIMVIGDQSHGKSALVRALSGCDFDFIRSDKGCCTRVPLKV
jgi:hypothetical protein